MKSNEKLSPEGVRTGYSTPETVLVLFHQTDPLCVSPRGGSAESYTEENLDWDE